MDETKPADEAEGEAVSLAEVSSIESGQTEESAAASSARTVAAVSETTLKEDGEPIGDEEESDEERLEEIERDGKKATIPAWLKSELRLQADHGRQTAELAEERRALETERDRIGQAVQQEIGAQANLLLIERQLERYSKLDWNALYDTNATEGQKAFTQFQLLKDARAQTLTYLGSLSEERRASARKEIAKRREEFTSVLTRDVPDWSPQTADRLFEFGQRHYGFTREDLEEADDPRAMKVLHAAYQWEEHQAQQRRALGHAAAQTTRPAAKLGGASPKAGLDDRLSAEEWLRRRNEQLRKKG